MIFISKTDNSIWIPKHRNHSGPLTLTMKHNLTGTLYVFDNLVNVTDSGNYWSFTNLNFSNLQSGEYNYNLNDIETGLLQVEHENKDDINYNTEKTIIQYGG